MKHLIRYLIPGLLFGVYNEIFFAPMWEYSDYLRPFFGEHIPVVAIPGWSIAFGVLLYIRNMLKGYSRIIKSVSFIFITIITFGPVEYLCSRNGLWMYKYYFHENVISMLIGYCFVALIIEALYEHIKSSSSL